MAASRSAGSTGGCIQQLRPRPQWRSGASIRRWRQQQPRAQDRAPMARFGHSAILERRICSPIWQVVTLLFSITNSRKFDKCTERPSMLSGLWLQASKKARVEIEISENSSLLVSTSTGRELVDKQYWRSA